MSQPASKNNPCGSDEIHLSSTISNVSDVFCFLVPNSPAANAIVARTAIDAPQHVLFNDCPEFFRFFSEISLESCEGNNGAAFCLALRRSSEGGLKSKHRGFIFGRNPSLVDITCEQGTSKLISNQHFCIYDGRDGHLRCTDSSTNGTKVDGQLLQRESEAGTTRKIASNTSICIESNDSQLAIEFNVVVPRSAAHLDHASRRVSRDDMHYIDAEVIGQSVLVITISWTDISK